MACQLCQDPPSPYPRPWGSNGRALIFLIPLAIMARRTLSHSMALGQSIPL